MPLTGSLFQPMNGKMPVPLAQIEQGYRHRIQDLHPDQAYTYAFAQLEKTQQ